MKGSCRAAHLTRVSLAMGFLLLLATGCSPSRTLARAILKAPNTYPTWLAPAASVTLRFPPGLVTNLTSERIEVGPPVAKLWVSVIDPGDYQARLSSSERVRGAHQGLVFSMRATFPPAPLPGSEPARGTVFLLHGYGVDSISLMPWALTIAEAGYQAVLVDLRGHGDSTGRQVFFGTVEVNDLRQALDHLIRQGTVREPVAVMGESLGGALALRWAAEDRRVATVIALAPYAELVPAILGVRDEYASWLPRRLAAAAARHLSDLLGVSSETLDTVSFMARLAKPVMLVAAGHDLIAPPRSVGRLARLCGGPIKYVAVPAAGHASLPYHFSELKAPVLEWLDAYCCAEPKGPALAER